MGRVTRWKVIFDMNASVSVEAETEDEAREAAIKTLQSLGIDCRHFVENCNCAIETSVTKGD